MIPPLVPVSTSHAEVMGHIHEAAFPPDEVWSATVLALHAGLPGGFGLMDPRGGFVLARTIMDESEILTIGVVPQARRLGIGARLLRAVMTEAASMAATTMFLEVATHNGAARALYAGLGFQEVGLRKRYYPNGDDALVMRVALTSPGG